MEPNPHLSAEPPVAPSLAHRFRLPGTAGEAGREFNSSRRGPPADLHLGDAQLLRGWQQGLLGLCEGARATLIVPPDLGYGADGDGPDVPGGATLNYDVEVIRVGEVSVMSRNLFKMLDTDASGTITWKEVPLPPPTGRARRGTPLTAVTLRGR